MTGVHTTVDCDPYFPMDEDPDWDLAEILRSGEENGIPYEMCLYVKSEQTPALSMNKAGFSRSISS